MRVPPAISHTTGAADAVSGGPWDLTELSTIAVIGHVSSEVPCVATSHDVPRALESEENNKNASLVLSSRTGHTWNEKRGALVG